MKKIILVNVSYTDELTCIGHSELVFAVESGDAETVGKDIMEGLALQAFNGSFALFSEIRKEIEDHAEDILLTAEGKRDSFTLYGDMVYRLKECEVDAGLVNSRGELILKEGDTLFIEYDEEDNEIGIYGKARDSGNVACVPFFRKNGNGQLSAGQKMPFVLRGAEGYLTDSSGVEIAGPYKYASVLGGDNFLVATTDGIWSVIDAAGNVKVDGIHPSNACNGYLQFEKDGKQGFFELSSGVMSPLFDEVDPIEMGEAIRVKKDGELGYLAEDFTFLPVKEIKVNDGLSDEIYWFGWE